LDHSWINYIGLSQGLDVEHIQQFVMLWDLLSNVTLSTRIKDAFTWKFTSGETYLATSAYRMQFEGIILSVMDTSILKFWAPPKCKYFAGLVLHERYNFDGKLNG
jgi:hypothetical protein